MPIQLKSTSDDHEYPFLKGGGELGEITRSYQWLDTSLGDPATWPQSLRTTLSIILNSKFPMFLFWGPELICFYNDAYRPSLGNNGKHPAVGAKGIDLWPEIWDGIKPLIDQVMSGGEASWSEDQLLPIYRNGNLEDVYWTFSYSPVFDETGSPAGVFVTCTETTEKVLFRKEADEIQELLAAANEELSATNEEMMASNEELSQSQDELLFSNSNLLAKEEHLRLATQAAGLGTFDMDLKNGTMEWDSRCRELFGISHNDVVTYENDFLPGLYQDDRERVGKLIAGLFDGHSNGDYDVEYRTMGIEDQKIRWVRAKGKVFFNGLDEPVRFIGAVIEITDVKADEQRKNDFIGMVSHELKTPLTSLKGYVQLLERQAKKRSDEFSIDTLGRVERQVNKMSGMINGFLNLSRLESGKIHLDTSEFNLEDLLEEIIEETRLISSTHHITFERGNTVIVNADRDKIGHVVSNFLGNAIKYSNADTAVVLQCKISAGIAYVSVSDMGQGIREEDIGKLFDRFYRIETNASHISGFGIGLYLSAEIIERHNGKVWVESEIGIGSTFHFSLPLNNR